MSIKSNRLETNPEFESLFTFKTQDEKLEHRAQMISYRILSEIEKLCEERKIKKKDLAIMIGSSKSYITQLFRGIKQVNTSTMAKLEEGLGISFEIKAKSAEETDADFLGKQLEHEILNGKKFRGRKGVFFYCQTANLKRDATKEFVDNIEKKDTKMQKAG